MKFWFSARFRWIVVIALWGVIIAFAIGGFRQQARDSGIGRSNLETIYLTFQLSSLEFKASAEYLNWRLQIARFLVPLMAAGTLLQGASVIFVDQFRRFRLRYVHGHTVICGLDDVGTRLALAYAEQGETVVAIEPDPTAAGAGTVKDVDVTVLAGDPTDPVVQRTARIDRATRLIAACPDDATNVQVALTAVDVAAGRDGKALRCAVHLTDAELTNLLRTADLDAQGNVRLSFFNTHERAARALIAEHPPFAAASPHIMVLGLGRFGRSIVVNVAHQWADLHPDRSLRITLVDASASGKWEALQLQHPALADACDAHVLDFHLEAPAPDSVQKLTGIFAGDRPTWIAVAHVEESVALSTAFFLHQSLGVRDVPIVVRTRTQAGLGALLIPGSRASVISNMHVFPFLDRSCTPAVVEGGLREQLAQAVHEDYVAHADRSHADAQLLRPWVDLDDDQRDLSRRRVDGIIADLAAIHCELAPLRRWGGVQVTFTDDELDCLASREHQRWFDDRVKMGWTYGPERDNDAKQNPLLVPWDELPAGDRAANIDSARALAPMLARAGFEPART